MKTSALDILHHSVCVGHGTYSTIPSPSTNRIHLSETQSSPSLLEGTKPLLVSIETPFNTLLPWKHCRNIQYAILANLHATSLGEVTWIPHLANTQFCRLGFNGYIGDNYGTILVYLFGGSLSKYTIGRERTLQITNIIRTTHLDKIVCYTDFGITDGMQRAIKAATDNGITVELRTLPPELLKEVFGQSLLSTLLPLTKYVCIMGLAGYGLRCLFGT